MALTFGFEEFSLGDVNEKFCLESFHSNSKDLVLIAAPVDFDVSRLKGETVILDGSTSVSDINSKDENEEEDIPKWEMHATRYSNDHPSSLLLPSTVEKNHNIGPGVAASVNIIRSVKIPHLKYPKKRKTISRLPRPDYLRVRWKPFGSGQPMKKLEIVSDKSSASQLKNTNTILKTSYSTLENGNNKQSVKETKKKKKKEKKIKQEDVHEDKFTREQEENDGKKNSKKISKKNDKKTEKYGEVANKNTTFKKSTHDKKSSKVSDSDLDSEAEDRIFGVHVNHTKNDSLFNQRDSEAENSKRKKKKKRKHSSELTVSNNNHDEETKKLKVDSEYVQKKKKKKKKNVN